MPIAALILMAKKKTAKKASGKSSAGKKEVKDIKIDLSALNQCPQCGSGNIFYSRMRDEIVCRDCGGIFSKLTPDQMKRFKTASKLL